LIKYYKKGGNRHPVDYDPARKEIEEVKKWFKEQHEGIKAFYDS